MSRTRRLFVIAVAWAVPIAWAVLSLASGPSDGAVIAGERWGDTVAITQTYGDTQLREDDTVLEIDGRTIDEWLSGDPPQRQVGDPVDYHLLRAGDGLDVDVTVEVSLQRYPVRSAVAENLPILVLAALPLAAASLVLWRRPEATASWAFLAGSALAPAVITSEPLGLGPIDLAGGRGVWPHAGGQAAFALSLGCLLLVALTFVATPAWLRRRPWLAAVAFLVPLAGYAVWAVVAVTAEEPGAARLQSLITIAAPAFLATAPVAAGVLLHAYLTAPGRQDRVALRLVLLALAGGLGTRLLLVDLPRQVIGEPLIPPNLLTVVIVPSVLACVVVAMLRYRLDEIEPNVRRALVQALAAAVVGTVFVALASTVDLASDTTFESLVAGGVLALLLLPLALGLQRGVRHFMYGDRELLSKVVSDLRAIDPLTAPAEVLSETLELLARRLHLSYAAIEVFAERPEDRIETKTGEPRGHLTTVDLRVGGSQVGRLLVEVDPDRDPFGPGDRRLLEDVGNQVGTLVQAVAINRELQRSRQDLVTAREEERRRMRRDLHDGLGPSLATLAMGLEAARDLIAENPARAAQLVGDLSEQAREEILDVRRLVDGLRPPALDQLGLVSALRQRAEEHNGAARVGTGARRMRWEVDATDDLEPLPAATEVAAFWIVVEAVNNAARHSAADRCAVTLRRESDCLWIRVRDRGVGLGPGDGTGVGLSSMTERAEELGGTCTVTSNGVGTLVEARLPLPATTADGERT